MFAGPTSIDLNGKRARQLTEPFEQAFQNLAAKRQVAALQASTVAIAAVASFFF
jgi:hypothetical protein